MSQRWIATGSVMLFLGGCGGFNIADASERIAQARGCDPAELTLVEGDDAYDVQGCGESARFTCADDQCSETASTALAAASSAVDEARQGLASLEGAILDCVGGSTPLSIQVRFSESGQPSAVRGSPTLDGEQRACVGYLVLGINVGGGGELLVSHTFGAYEPEGMDVDHTPLEEPPVEEPLVEEPLVEDAPIEDAPVEDAPVEDGSTDDGSTEAAPVEGEAGSEPEAE